MERLVRKCEYPKAKKFISGLRAKSDPPPQVIKPTTELEGYKKQNCAVNSVLFCQRNPGFEPVRGFKLWVLPELPGLSTPYVALVHVVVRHKESLKYQDVTPPDEGDEGQELIFVPSSRIYTDWSVEEIAEYCQKGLQIRMGAVCIGLALKYKQDEVSSLLYQATPESLKLFVCPKVETMQEHLCGMRQEDIAYFLKPTGAEFIDNDGTTFCMVDAGVYRHLFQCTVDALKHVEEAEAAEEGLVAAVGAVSVE